MFQWHAVCTQAPFDCVKDQKCTCGPCLIPFLGKRLHEFCLTELKGGEMATDVTQRTQSNSHSKRGLALYECRHALLAQSRSDCLKKTAWRATGQYPTPGSALGLGMCFGLRLGIERGTIGTISNKAVSDLRAMKPFPR